MLAETSATSAPAAAPRVDPRLVLSLAAVYIIWSSTYLAIRFAIAELPPLLTASLRFSAAGLVLLLVALRRGAAWPSTRDWLRAVPIGALLFLGGNGFVMLGEQSVPSGGAAVVCATMPLWVGVLGVCLPARRSAALRGPAEPDLAAGARPTRREWLSLVIGFVGVVVLMGGPTLAGKPAHVALLILSPISWAAGSILARRLRAASSDPVMTPAIQMVAGGAVLFVIAAIRGERFPVHASASAWAAVSYLFLFGSVLGFTAYSWLLRNARPVVATSYAYVNPILAVVIGAAISGEPLGITTVIANVLIVGAIWLALRKPRAAVTPATK